MYKDGAEGFEMSSSIKRIPKILFQPQGRYLKHVKNLSRCTLNEIGEEKRWRNRG
ncbi:MAG: hypothetical protein SBU_000235 [Candidatus Syntrophoarchaeum butanivorans]|uniref:Uncharacterized protein n=1 Tax=Candidatus Syntropharchaeum butanivorans TaxID=1839936 RepID=A0A1F2P7H1_9EURY|nr:MAG: hypothetical protein SBU_000235 [Candidatus Syntrophoarchaeum butanivorans]